MRPEEIAFVLQAVSKYVDLADPLKVKRLVDEMLALVLGEDADGESD